MAERGGEFARGYAFAHDRPHYERPVLAPPCTTTAPRSARRYLPGLHGQIFAANSLTEPEGGTGRDINAQATRDGDYYILNGHKWLITQFPGLTTPFYAFASTEEGMTCFWWTPRPRASSPSPCSSRWAARAPPLQHLLSRSARARITDPGGQGKGLDIASGMPHPAGSPSPPAAWARPNACWTWPSTTPSAATPSASPWPRAAIQGNVAQMATEIEAARLLYQRAAWMYDQGQDIVTEAAMAKVFSEQMVVRVAEMALRIHGGVGFTQAYPLERHFRDCRSFHFEEGTEEIQKLLIARSLLR